ncbi:MAG: PIN domain-containing protein [Betaproteobacteria bacterium]|nr:PIN domain-containing protein [Betaproteobacteria bacterium]
MSKFFIIDTNVVVAGLLTSRSDSPVAQILDGMLAAAFAFVVSEALLSEYRAVLLRPKLARLHGLTADEVDSLLTDIARHATVLVPPSGPSGGPIAPDLGDQLLWNLLAMRDDLVLVTGDKLLLGDPAMQERIIQPQTLMARLKH